MRALLIDENVRSQINDVIDYSHKNPYSMDDLLDTINGQMLPAGDNPKHVIHIPIGYRVVYSIEHQVHGDLKHISISVDTIGRLPSSDAVSMILEEFGFNNCKDFSNFLKIEIENNRAV